MKIPAQQKQVRGNSRPRRYLTGRNVFVPPRLLGYYIHIIQHLIHEGAQCAGGFLFSVRMLYLGVTRTRLQRQRDLLRRRAFTEVQVIECPHSTTDAHLGQRAGGRVPFAERSTS